MIVQCQMTWLRLVFTGMVLGQTADDSRGDENGQADVLFSCTSCLDCSNINFFHLVRGLKSVLVAEKNSSVISRIMEVVVVNEVRPPGSSLSSWSTAVQKLMPNVRFIQKDGAKQKGQAYSLNLIVRRLAEAKAKYWLHWEESWEAVSPFLSRAIAAMEASEALQVELSPTDEWQKFMTATPLPGQGRVIQAPPTMRECNWTRLWGTKGFDRSYWPLFTLHPSLNNVERVIAADPFSEDDDKWPVIFEFQWACTLVRGGARKSALVPPPVMRQSGHKSSYSRLGNLRRLGICAVMDPEYPHCSAA